jgi:predicted RNA binding protein YcfA (HicA-like mRNA interferase family)
MLVEGGHLAFNNTFRFPLVRGGIIHPIALQEPLMKVRDILKLMERDGWVLKNQEGSHRHCVHPVKPGKVTVAGKPGDDTPNGTAKAIMKQAGVRE